MIFSDLRYKIFNFHMESGDDGESHVVVEIKLRAWYKAFLYCKMFFGFIGDYIKIKLGKMYDID